MRNRGIGVGFVYVMTHKDRLGESKVGYTMLSPKKRAREIGYSGNLSGSCDVHYYVKLLNPYEIEQLTHRILLKKFNGRWKCEWFKCSIEDAIWGIKEAIYIKRYKIPGFFISGEKYQSVYTNERMKRFFYLKKQEEIQKITNDSLIKKRDIGINFGKKIVLVNEQKDKEYREEINKQPSLLLHLLMLGAFFLFWVLYS